MVNITDFKCTRPLNLIFSEPNDRCDILFFLQPYHDFAISSSCNIISNDTAYSIQINNQRNKIRIDRYHSEYYIYAYNCTSSVKGAESISVSWTKYDPATTLYNWWIGYLIFNFLIIIFPCSLIILYFEMIRLFCVVDFFLILSTVADIVLIAQEGFYREDSIEKFQKVYLAFWPAINSFAVAYLLLFIFGFKTKYKKYNACQITIITLTSLVSFALNLFNTFVYYVVDRKMFSLISSIIIPITVLIELGPFIIKWITSSQEINRASKELDPNTYHTSCTLNYHCVFNIHNIIGLLQVLIQCLTPIYMYINDFNPQIFIAAAITHMFLPKLFFWFLCGLVDTLHSRFINPFINSDIENLPYNNTAISSEIQNKSANPAELTSIEDDLDRSLEPNLIP